MGLWYWTVHLGVTVIGNQVNGGGLLDILFYYKMGSIYIHHNQNQLVEGICS